MQSAFALARSRVLPVFVTSLFVLFIVMLPRYTDTAKIWFALLILTALGYLVLNLRQFQATTVMERTFFAAVTVNFLWIAFTYYANREPVMGAGFVWDRHFYSLFLVPLFFLFRNVSIPDRVIVPGMFFSILVSFIDILLDLAQGMDHRLQGMNPNAFGPIQLCLSGILLFYFIRIPESWLRWVALAGFLLGIANVIFSKSRSTWITLAVLCILFAVYFARSQSVLKKTALLIAIVLLISGSYLLPIVKSRIDNTIVNVSNYIATDDYRDISRRSSIGVRLELWKTGWHIFLENPLLGVGVGGFRPAAQANWERYQVNEVVSDFKYVHNQYLAILSTRGVPGLIFFLLVICLPIYIAMSSTAEKRETGYTNLAIMLICLNYIIGGFAEDHFEGKSAIMFVTVMLSLLLARISTSHSPPTAENSR